MKDAAATALEKLRDERMGSATRLILTYLSFGRANVDAREAAIRLKGELSEDERMELAALVFDAINPEQALEFCRAWFAGQGAPGVSLMESPVADAEFWASGANSKELGAYAMACFKNMPQKRRADFIKWAGKHG